MALPDTAWVKKRAWLVYPVLAAAATTVYYLVGQNSLLFNLIGLTSPILIIVAVKIHAPEKRWPWYLIAIGQFLFIAGDVVSYNYVLFHDVFPQLFPLDFAFNPAGDVPFPGPADALYLAVYPCLITGLLLMIHARNPGRDRTSLLDSLMVAIGVATVSWVLLDLAVHPHRRPRSEDQAHRHGLPGHGPAPRGRGDPPRRRRRPQAGGLLPDDHRHRGAVRHRRHLRLVRPVHGVGLPTGKRAARSRLDGLLRAAGHRGAASVDA